MEANGKRFVADRDSWPDYMELMTENVLDDREAYETHIARAIRSEQRKRKAPTKLAGLPPTTEMNRLLTAEQGGCISTPTNSAPERGLETRAPTPPGKNAEPKATRKVRKRFVSMTGVGPDVEIPPDLAAWLDNNRDFDPRPSSHKKSKTSRGRVTRKPDSFSNLPSTTEMNRRLKRSRR